MLKFISFLFDKTPEIITQTKILISSKEEKSNLKYIKFFILMSGWFGVANAEFLKNLMSDDLLLIAEIITKHPYIKYSLIFVLIGYSIKTLFKIDVFEIIAKIILNLPKFLWFILIKIVIGFFLTIFSKEITFLDYFKTLFYPIWKASKIYYINTISNNQVAKIQEEQNKIRREIATMDLTTKQKAEKKKKLKANQSLIGEIRKEQDNQILSISDPNKNV